MARGVFVAGADASAAELNDAFAPPYCRIRRTGAAQTINNTTTTALQFDNETEDVGGIHDNAVNNTRMTAPAGGAGVWEFGVNAEVAANATGRRELSLRVNGSVFIASVSDPSPSGTNVSRLHLTTFYRLAVGDYVEAVLWQNSGGGLNISVANEYTPIAWARWVCP